MAIFYLLKFEIPATWRARSSYLYPPGIGGPVIPPGSGFPPPHGRKNSKIYCIVYISTFLMEIFFPIIKHSSVTGIRIYTDLKRGNAVA
jgi:hypothetical protein